MRTLFISLFAFFSITTIIAQTTSWTKLNSGTTTDLHSVYFIDTNTGYAVGGNYNLQYSGIILKTTNGGKTWITQNYNGYPLQSVYFYDSNTGYVLSGYVDTFWQSWGNILKTKDKGKTWGNIYYSSDLLSSIYFYDSNTGYAAGTSFIKTTNGGKTWAGYGPPFFAGNLNSFCFTDSNTAYVVGGYYDDYNHSYGVISKTINKGISWSLQDSGSGFIDSVNCLYSVCFPSTNIGYTVGDYGTILKTTNSGTTWSKQNSYIRNSLYSIYFTDSISGYTVGSGGIILNTINGGKTWLKQIPYYTIGDLNSIYFPNTKIGYAVGTGGLILKTTNGGGSVSINNSISASYPLKAYPNPTTSNLILELPQQPIYQSTLTIYNTTGQLLLTQQITSQKTELDISNLIRGVYILKYYDNKSLGTLKIIKE